MKLRKGFIVGMVSLLGVTAMAGCKKKGEDKKLTKVSINGIQRTYEKGDTIDWNAIRVTATYSDASTVTFSKFEYDVTSVTSNETQAVVYTSGLHAQTALVEGVYAISVAFPSDLSTKHSVGNISVGNATPDNYALVECSDPTLKTGYKANIKDAGTEIEPERNDKEVGKANENKFIGKNTQYVVGTLNPFIYEPEVSFENILDPTADLISGDDIHFRKNHVVKVKSGDNYVDAPAADYTVVNGHVKFNDSAIGKTFSLTVSLSDFDVVEGTSKKAESTFEGFTVQKGLNIYNAKQLGVLNVTKLTTQELNAQKYNEHHGDTDQMFWNGTDYYRPVLNEVWENYLLSSGTFTTEELQAYKDTPAIFLQRKLEVKTTDIPSGYIITASEPASAVKGCLRDSIPLYAPIVGQNDVEINGNFWTLDTTALPLCKNDRSNNGPKPYIEGQEDVVIMPGHTPVIKFCGIESESDDVFYTNQVANSKGNGIIRNINTIGNTGTDLVSADFDKMLTLTGLIFAKNDYCGATYENCIIKQYQIGVFPNSMPGQAVNGHAQKDTTFVNATRVYDCANSGVFNYFNGGTKVSKSVFNRFGASPVMNAGSDRENRASNTKFTSDVILNNEITGEEIYFSALAATEAVGTIKGFNKFFKEIGNEFVYKIKDKNNKEVEVMNLVSIGINGDDYLEADTPAYHSNVILNAGANNELKASVKAETNQWAMYSNLRSFLHDALYDETWAKAKAAHDAAYAEQYAANWKKAQEEHDAAYAEQYAAGWAQATTEHNTAYQAIYDEQFEAGWAQATTEHNTAYQAAYNEQYAAGWEELTQAHTAAYSQAYATNWADAQAQHAAAELDAKRTFVRNYIAQEYEIDPENVSNDQIEAGLANEELMAYFEANYRDAFEAGFAQQAGFAFNEAAFAEYFNPLFEASFAQIVGFEYSEAAYLAYFNAQFEAAFAEEAGFAYNRDAYLAYFNAQFEAGFAAKAGFEFNEASFKAYFDPLFEAGFAAKAGFEFNEAAFKAYFDPLFEAGFAKEAGFEFNEEAFDEYFTKNIPQPPVFQTEVASELFWTDNTELKTNTGAEYKTTLEGSYLHLLAPVGNTCLSLVFRIGKLPVQA